VTGSARSTFIGRAIALATLAAVAGCTTTPAVTTGFYDIKASTASQIDREIRLKGPADGHAIAAAEIRFVPVALSKAVDARGCRVGAAQIRVNARIILPRWQDRAGSTPELKKAFDNLAAYAKVHERVHVEIANLAARLMEKQLLSVPPQKSCDALERKVERIIRDVRARHDRAQRAFDAAERKRLAKLVRDAEKRATGS
jgi:predicted secreted Zn-dependent protease